MEVNSQISSAVPLDYPEIEYYNCYRKFLFDFYQYKKSINPSFSFRLFSKISKIKSPNYLQLVMQGRRNMTLQTAHHVATGMKLSSYEKKYFISLVAKSLATSDSDIVQAQKDLLIAAKKLCEKKVPLAQKEILLKWHFLIVRELVTLKNFKFDGVWVSQTLRGYISAEEANHALHLLRTGGFIKFKNGKCVQEDPVLTTGESFNEEVIVNHHAEVLGLWSQKLFEFKDTERELGLLNIPISSKKIPQLQEKIRDFQSEIIGWLKDEENPDRIVQLGVYMIPISQ